MDSLDWRGQDATSYLSDAEQLLGFFAGSREHVFLHLPHRVTEALISNKGSNSHVSGNQESISPESFHDFGNQGIAV